MPTKRTPCDSQDQFAANNADLVELLARLPSGREAMSEAGARARDEIFRRLPQATKDKLAIVAAWWNGLTDLEHRYVIRQAMEWKRGPASPFDAWYLWNMGQVRTQPAGRRRVTIVSSHR